MAKVKRHYLDSNPFAKVKIGNIANWFKYIDLQTKQNSTSMFKKGDKVQILGRAFIGHILVPNSIGEIESGKVMESGGVAVIGVADDGYENPCRQYVHYTQLNLVNNNQVKNTNMNITKQEMKQAVETVANLLAKRDGNITTLPLKEELRSQFPNVLWNQYRTGVTDGVSDLFHELVREGKFRSIADNGTYQTYVPAKAITTQAARTAMTQLASALKTASAASTNRVLGGASRAQTAQVKRGLVKGSQKAKDAGAKAAKTRAANKAAGGVVSSGNRVGKAKARDMILNSKGIISVTFTKKDGTVRTLAGTVIKAQTELGLGYILMKDLVKTKKEGKEVIRRANIQTTKSFKMKKVTYTVA